MQEKNESRCIEALIGDERQGDQMVIDNNSLMNKRKWGKKNLQRKGELIRF